jgi:RNA polymerase sigma factor (sigma-70 family)
MQTTEREAGAKSAVRVLDPIDLVQPGATMSDEEPGSVTGLIPALKAGQPEAADAIWRRYYQRVVEVARQRLQFAPHRGIEDAEDVALSAIHGLCTGAAQGRFERLSNRDDLWQLLVTITVKKALCHRQKYDRLKRGGTHHVPRGQAEVEATQDGGGGDDANALDWVLSKEPTPESSAIIQEQFQELLRSLADSTLRQIALWRMDGLTNAEIAQKIGRVARTVERKLELIRLIWEEIAGTLDE